MNFKLKKIIPAMLIGSMLLTGCEASETSLEVSEASAIAGNEPLTITKGNESVAVRSDDESTGELVEKSAESQDYFSDRDLDAQFDRSDAISITFDGATIQADSDKVSINSTTLTIEEGGTYILSGNLEDGNVIVDAEDDAKIQLVLDGVSINSETFAPIYVVEADKVFVTLAEGKENVLTNRAGFTQIDDNEVDAVIFSKDDITLNGAGSLVIESETGHGIVGKDDVTITGGVYTITCAQTAVRANDQLAIADGSFTINADSDGLHAENEKDDSAGEVYIKGGSFDINAGDDGIRATTTLQIDGGTINIKAVEGLEATSITINDGDISIEATDDGINASKKSSIYDVKITFNGGNTTIVMGPGDTDGVDSNGAIEINGGTIDVTCNSAFDFDTTGVINAGTVIANGEEITELTNQMMPGGGLDMNGNPPEMNGNPPDMNGNPPDMNGNPPDMNGNPPDMNGNPPDMSGEQPNYSR